LITPHRLGQGTAFTFTEIRFALARKNGLNRLTASLFNQRIDIKERLVQALREQATNRAFAAA